VPEPWTPPELWANAILGRRTKAREAKSFFDITFSTDRFKAGSGAHGDDRADLEYG
jgi:hypothetical protein